MTLSETMLLLYGFIVCPNDYFAESAAKLTSRLTCIIVKSACDG